MQSLALPIILRIMAGKKNQPVVITATVTGNEYAGFISKGYKPKYTLAQMSKEGIKPVKHLAKLDRANLIRFQTSPTSYGYWLCLNNFYVITTYNPSLHYSMAVYQLGQKIESLKNQQHKMALLHNGIHPQTALR